MLEGLAFRIAQLQSVDPGFQATEVTLEILDANPREAGLASLFVEFAEDLGLTIRDVTVNLDNSVLDESYLGLSVREALAIVNAETPPC